MSHTRSVRIGPEFFSKTFNDYSDWKYALAREFLQNSADAPGSRTINVTLGTKGDNTRLIVANDGQPMTEDALVNKLLALGGSGKDGTSAVGTFGRAKELLLFCHLGYQVRTGSLVVTGSGAGYDLAESNFLAGTESSVLVAGDQVEELKLHFRRCITLSSWKGTFSLNGEIIEERLQRGKLRRDLGWARVYTNGKHDNLLVVAIGGLPMFCRRADYKGCVVVELTGKSSDVLQSSRDGLKWGYALELDQFLADLAVNRRKALQQPKVEVLHYPGNKLQFDPVQTEEKHEQIATTVSRSSSLVDAFEMAALVAGKGPAEETVAGGQNRLAASSRLLDCEFVVKNDTGLAIPAYYLPESFGRYAQLLVQRRRDILVELARLLAHREPFALGFYFSEGLEAAHERSQNYGHIVYVNPIAVTHNPGGSRSFAKRWKFDAAGNWRLLATALHEFCHLEGFGPHNEEFACRLSDLTALVLQNLKRFGRIFDRGGGR